MNGTPLTAAQTPKPRRRGRVVTILCLIAAVAGLAAAWSMGIPQTWAAGMALRAFLGMPVEVSGVSADLLGRGMGVQRLALYEDEAAQREQRPAVLITGLSVDTAAPWGAERMIRLVDVEEIIADVDARHPDSPFYPWLVERPVGDPDAAPFPLTYIPERIVLQRVTGSVCTPAYSAAIGPITADVTIATQDAFQAKVEGAAFTLRAATAETGELIAVDDAHAQGEAVYRKDTGMTLHPSRLVLPEWGVFEGEGGVSFADGVLDVAASVTTAQLKGRALDRLGAVYPLPVAAAFDELDASGSELRLRAGRDFFDARGSRAQAVVTDLRVGDETSPYYQGDLDFQIDGDSGSLAFAAVLDEGQRLEGHWAGDLSHAEAHAGLSGWSRAQVIDSVPGEYREAAGLESLDTIEQASVDVDLSWPAYSVTAETHGLLRTPDGVEPFQIRLTDGEGRWADDDDAGQLLRGLADIQLPGLDAPDARIDVESLHQWNVALAAGQVTPRTVLATFTGIEIPDRLDGELGLDSVHAVQDAEGLRVEFQGDYRGLGEQEDGVIRASADMRAPSVTALWPMEAAGAFTLPGAGQIEAQAALETGLDTLAGRVTLTDVDTAYAGALAQAPEALQKLQAPVSGGGTFRTTDAGAYGAAFEFSAAAPAYGEWSTPEETPIEIQGGLTVDPSLDAARWEQIEVEIPGYSAVTSENGQARFEPLHVWTELDGYADLDRLAPAYGMGDLQGYLEFSGPLTYEAQTVRLPFEAEGFGMAHGDFAAPYGVPLSVSGGLLYEVDNAGGRVETLRAALGEADRLQSEAVRFTLDPLVLEGPFVAETGFGPLVSLGHVASAEGNARAEGEARWSEEGPMVDAAVESRVSSLLLPDGIAAFRDAHVEGRIRHDAGELAGDVMIDLGEVTAAGVTTGPVRGPMVFRGDHAEAASMRAGLWDGDVVFDVRVGVLDPELPVELRAVVDNIDLERFSREFDPPGVYLTGRGRGEVGIKREGAEWESILVRLAAGDGFTMNRAMVQQLLLTHHVRDASGGRALDGIVTQVLGEAEQRPFERAELAMDLSPEQRLVGDGLLRSPLLNMTLDLAVDIEVIEDALQLRQEAELDEIEGFEFDAGQ